MYGKDVIDLRFSTVNCPTSTVCELLEEHSRETDIYILKIKNNMKISNHKGKKKIKLRRGGPSSKKG